MICSILILVACPLDAQVSYEIESDELEVFNQEGRAEFMGNVKIWNDTNEIHANRVEVFFEEGGDSIQIIKAFGDVEIYRENMFASSEFALHDVQSDTVMLQENAYVQRDQNEFWADRMWLDLTTERVRMKDNVRGHMIRTSRDRENR